VKLHECIIDPKPSDFQGNGDRVLQAAGSKVLHAGEDIYV
jgi:hypothetical protein